MTNGSGTGGAMEPPVPEDPSSLMEAVASADLVDYFERPTSTRKWSEVRAEKASKNPDFEQGVAEAKERLSAEDDQAPEDAIWSCKIGWATRSDLPEGADGPLRQAVEIAFYYLTGHDPQFTFSGWGAELTEAERDALNDG